MSRRSAPQCTAKATGVHRDSRTTRECPVCGVRAPSAMPALQGMRPASTAKPMLKLVEAFESATAEQIIDMLPRLGDDVSRWLAGDVRTSGEILGFLSSSSDQRTLRALADNTSTPPEALRRIYRSNPELSSEIIGNLSMDDQGLMEIIGDREFLGHESMMAMTRRCGRGPQVVGKEVVAAFLRTRLPVDAVPEIAHRWRRSPEVMSALLHSQNMDINLIPTIVSAKGLDADDYDDLYRYVMQSSPSQESKAQHLALVLCRDETPPALIRNAFGSLDTYTGRRVACAAVRLHASQVPDEVVGPHLDDEAISDSYVRAGVRYRIADRTGIDRGNEEALEYLISSEWWRLHPDDSEVVVAKMIHQDSES